MTVTELEQRVAALERELNELKESLRKPPREKDWRSTAGMFTGDEVFAEMVREGRNCVRRNWNEAFLIA